MDTRHHPLAPRAFRPDRRPDQRVVLSASLIPPVGLALAACLGGLIGLGRRGLWRVVGRLVAWVSMILLIVLAMPFTGRTLLVALETGLPVPGPGFHPGAIVVLGGDEKALAGPNAPADIGPLTLERLRFAALEQRRTGLPLLTSGGVLWAGNTPLAALMADSLQNDFGVPVRWIEPASLDTWQNARFSADILRRAGISDILVVTHPWHMRRALMSFARTGLVAFPAQLPMDRPPHFSLGALLPTVAGWEMSYEAMHEWIGCAYYALR